MSKYVTPEDDVRTYVPPAWDGCTPENPGPWRIHETYYRESDSILEVTWARWTNPTQQEFYETHHEVEVGPPDE